MIYDLVYGVNASRVQMMEELGIKPKFQLSSKLPDLDMSHSTIEGKSPKKGNPYAMVD
mgnify:CR=1 FL=1